jgi:hypothetical protein
MNIRTIVALVFVSLASIFNPAHAVVIGGDEVGWTIDFDKVTPEQKQMFGWSDSILKNNFQKFSNTYSVPGHEKWTFVGKAVVSHVKGGPAMFSIMELLDGTTIEEFKKIHYLGMSERQGFKEDKCVLSANKSLSCDVFLNNWTPAKIFHAVFYEWKVGDRTFVLVVRNAQASPDRETPEKAMGVLIPLITRK